VPGIDYATIFYCTWNDRVALAVWVDHDKHANTSQQYTYPDDGKARWGSEFEGLEGGPSVAVAWTTPDGVSEPVMINDQKFDVTEGWLLLVSRADKKVRIKQLKRDALQVRPDSEGGPTKDLAVLKTDPEVVAFFTQKK
jgi:hypothetical protein